MEEVIMSDEKMTKHEALNMDARNSILEAIRVSVSKEKLLDLERAGSIATALDSLAARNLYSKGPTGNNYSKNTQRVAFDNLTRPSDLGGLE
jgi:hypothetical protein